MFFRRICLTVSPLLMLAVISQANEAPKAGAPDAQVEQYSGSQNQEWEKVQGRLSALKTKVDAQEALVKSLAADKVQLQGQALVSKVEELKKEYATLRDLTAEYNKLNEEYLTKYPERGLKEKRVYPRVEAKPLSAYENDTSLNGQVNRVHKKILQKYSRSKQQKDAATSDSKKTETESKNTQSEEPSSSVTDPIIYKK
ncbi:hypothetical protein [Pseudobdellovibrio exovorus]|uniref:Uncharacterized protein n=1 Tax=Pseudobdellovibrio exovorus JSS TaxID=1184267 RepID=M4V890_9BACT|nr:hypothetical protein [Pseudobdellovibrio exovorus]AGH94665.1 hypothetical protein A11Q_445 [Pseudobdellovibrio exovorus JSS]